MRKGKLYLKKTLLLVAGLLVSVLIGAGLMTAVSALPTNQVMQHVAESAWVFESEETYQTVTEYRNSKLDNYTDALMLMECMVSNGNAFQDAMLAYLPINDKPTQVLIDFAHNGTIGELADYARYWHGYKVVLKPILLFTSYYRFRQLNFIVMILTILVVIVLLYRNKIYGFFLPYVVLVWLLAPETIYRSIQYSVCFYIMQAFLILYLLFEKKIIERKLESIFFMMIGVITAFNDLLTYPIVPFGILFIFYFYRNKGDLLKDILKMVSLGTSWAFGYGGMWGAKWILATLTTSVNVIEEGKTNVAIRSEAVFSFKDVWLANYHYLFDGYVKWIVIGCVLCLLVFKTLYKGWKVRDIIVFGIISLLPAVWYSWARQHSGIHLIFVNKDLVVFAIAYIVMCLPDFKRKKIKIHW